MKPLYQSILATLLFLVSSQSYSQEVLWTMDMQDKMTEAGWITQLSNGHILAAGSTGTMVIDNSTGEEVWHNKELKALLKHSFQEINGTPLSYCESQPVMDKARGFVIHSGTGKVLYDTKDGNYRIKNYLIMPSKGLILFELTAEKRRYLLNFSLETLQETWIADLGEIKGLKDKLTNISGPVSFIDHGPDFINDKQLLLAINERIFALDQNTGQSLWTYEGDKDLTAMVYSQETNGVYIGVKKDKKLTVLDPDSGDDITPGKLKLKGTLIDIGSDPAGNIILVETEGFNLINPTSQDLVWKKSFKIEYLDEVIPMDKGYIAIGKDENNGSISYVNHEGKDIWKSKIKGYTYYTSLTNAGILYISTERSNILSYDDGKDIWDKDVKFRAIPAVAYDEEESRVVMIDNGNVYKFDLSTGQINVVAEKLKLEGVSKVTPLLAESIPQGYLAYTPQLMSLISKDGKLVYTKEYPQVKSFNYSSLGTLGLASLGIDFDIEGNMENIKTLDRIAKGGSIESNRASEGTVDESVAGGLYFNDDPVFEIIKKRYSNSKLTKDSQYILTTNESNDPGIHKINKGSGETEKIIPLQDKSPQYVIDDIDSRVFVNEKYKILTCYQM